MITYEQVIKVRLDGKHVGDIKEVTGGYAYFPKAGIAKEHGDIFPTVEAVKATL